MAEEKKMSFMTFIILTFMLFLVFLTITYSYGLFDGSLEKTNKFSEIKSSLISGNKLRMVIHFNKMDMFVNGSKVKGPNTVSGIEVNNFEFFNSTSTGKKSTSFLTITNTQLVNHQVFGVVNNIMKANFFHNNTLEIQVTYSSLNNLKVLSQETFNSSLSLGSVYFFNVAPQKYTLEDNLGNRESLF